MASPECPIGHLPVTIRHAWRLRDRADLRWGRKTEKIKAPAKPIGSGYASAAAKRPFQPLKRCETSSQRGEAHQRGPHISVCNNHEHRHNEKRRSAAFARHIFRCDEKCGLEKAGIVLCRKSGRESDLQTESPTRRVRPIAGRVCSSLRNTIRQPHQLLRPDWPRSRMSGRATAVDNARAKPHNRDHLARGKWQECRRHSEPVHPATNVFSQWNSSYTPHRQDNPFPHEMWPNEHHIPRWRTFRRKVFPERG